jgi:hypothetical protein
LFPSPEIDQNATAEWDFIRAAVLYSDLTLQRKKNLIGNVSRMEEALNYRLFDVTMCQSVSLSPQITTNRSPVLYGPCLLNDACFTFLLMPSRFVLLLLRGDHAGKNCYPVGRKRSARRSYKMMMSPRRDGRARGRVLSNNKQKKTNEQERNGWCNNACAQPNVNISEEIKEGNESSAGWD